MIKIKNKESERMIKFTIFSLSAGIIQFGTFALFNEVINLPHWASYLFSLILSVLWNFTFNREFTFKSSKNYQKAMTLVALFYLVFTPTTTVLEHYLTDICFWNEYIVQIMIMIGNLITEYLYNRYIVYRGSLDTNKRALNEI